MITEKQTKLAQQAVSDPAHRFDKVYDLLHWRPWIEQAAQTVLRRQGSQTAGVDGQTRWFWNQDPEGNLAALRLELKRGRYQPLPVKRVHIPKGNGKRRPLGIPTLKDRIVQEALRMILDPIFESDFHHDSYGFRKGRRTMDAVAPIRTLCNNRSKYFVVIEGDIKSYFDTIHHKKLMTLLKRRVADKRLLQLIWQYLKAGVMEGPLFQRNEAGVPQGGIISPVLANLYLNEFDRWCEARWGGTLYQKSRRRARGAGNYRLLRYADDFILLSNGTMAEARQVKREIKAFLREELHLELSEEKTLITHINEGFTFLGFHIQRVTNHEGRWVIHLRPSQESSARIKRRLKEMTSRQWFWMDEYTRLNTMNSVVRGWCAYYRHTTLIADIERIVYHAHMRYQGWLLKKYQKRYSKRTLYRTRTATYLNRDRWFATLQIEGKVKTVYQWKPTRTEYQRSVYIHRSEAQIGHPYLAPTETDYPQWEGSAPIADIRLYPNQGEPFDIIERKAKAKLRDGYRCQQCGEQLNQLEVHHIRGKRDNRTEALITLCKNCHHRLTSNRLMESRMR